MAWKDANLIESLIQYPLANQRAKKATVGTFTIHTHLLLYLGIILASHLLSYALRFENIVQSTSTPPSPPPP